MTDRRAGRTIPDGSRLLRFAVHIRSHRMIYAVAIGWLALLMAVRAGASPHPAQEAATAAGTGATAAVSAPADTATTDAPPSIAPPADAAARPVASLTLPASTSDTFSTVPGADTTAAPDAAGPASSAGDDSSQSSPPSSSPPSSPPPSSPPPSTPTCTPDAGLPAPVVGTVIGALTTIQTTVAQGSGQTPPDVAGTAAPLAGCGAAAAATAPAASAWPLGLFGFAW